MPWVRLEDDFYDNGKFAVAGPLGLAMWVAGLAYCNRNLTDGVITRSAAKRLLDFEGVHWRAWDGELVGGCENVDPIDLAEHLVACGLWEAHPRGYLVHDYLEYQPSAQKVRDDREAKSRAGKAGVEAKRKKADAQTPAEADAQADDGAPDEAPALTEVAAEPKQNVSPVPKPTPNPDFAAAAANARADEILDTTGPWLDGTRESLRPHVVAALEQNYDPVAVKVGLVEWQHRTERGPGLLPLLIDDAVKRGAKIAASRPPWCGQCNEQTRRLEDDDHGDAGKCPDCHPEGSPS